jgi:hypothetical protein
MAWCKAYLPAKGVAGIRGGVMAVAIIILEVEEEGAGTRRIWVVEALPLRNDLMMVVKRSWRAGMEKRKERTRDWNSAKRANEQLPYETNDLMINVYDTKYFKRYELSMMMMMMTTMMAHDDKK